MEKDKRRRIYSKLDEEKLPENIRKAENGYEIDIANSSYAQLSADWQAENKAAAKVVAEIVESEKELTIDEVGTIIHDKWLERNDWAKGSELDVPFVELPKVEQDKDLDQYRIALEIATAELTIEDKKVAKKEKTLVD